MNELEVMNVFPKALGVTELPFFHEELLVSFAETLEYKESLRGKYDGSLSIDNQILNDSHFLDVKKQILAYALLFGRNVLEHLFEDIHISCSWINKLTQGQSVAMHSHNNSYISGVLYLTEGSPITFADFNRPSAWEPKISKLNEFNDSVCLIKPSPGRLILFQSALVHGVEASPSLHPRYSIGFNIVPVGEIGYSTSFLQLYPSQ